MFFENSRIRFFKLVNSIVNNIERISTKNRNTINIVYCLKCWDNLILFKCHRFIDNPNNFSLTCRKKVHDNREFGRENSKPRCKSQITTR